MNRLDIASALRTTAELAADYYFALRVHPHQGKLVTEWVSPEFYEITGIAPALGTPHEVWDRSLCPRQLAMLEERWTNALRGQDAVYHRRLLTASGRTIIVREAVRVADIAAATPILYGLGCELVGVESDDAAGCENEDRYRSLFDRIPVGIYRTTPTGQIIDANAALVRMFGYPDRATLTGCNVSDLYADPRDRVWELAEFEQRDVMLGVALRVRRFDGGVIWVEDNARAIRDAKGKVLYFEGTIEDITARRQAEEDLLKARDELERRVDERTADLRASEQRFRAVTEAVPIPMLISREADGLILYANHPLGEMFGLPRDDLIGRATTEFYVNPEDRRALRAELDSNGQLEAYEVRVRKNNGSPFWIMASMRKMLYKGEASLITGLYDITDRKRAEAAMTQAKDAAEAANQAKSRFLANMSHEIRTPITAMLGAAEVMSPVGPLTEQQRCVDMILRNGRHLLTLVDDLLDLARLEAGRLRVQATRTSLPDILRDVRAVTEHLHDRKDVDYRIRYETAVPEYIHTDAVRLKQAVINLANNALRLTDRGYVWVRVRVERDDPDPRLTIAVEDTGIGMPTDSLDEIFEAFAQIEPVEARRTGGVGLGLAVARWIAERLGGSLEVQSQAGRGSTFTLRVATGPLDDTEWSTPEEWSIASAGASIGSAQQSTCRLNGRILLAEDAPDTRELIRHALTNAGAHVVAVSNGADAVKAGIEQEFDLALIDIRMPVMDGLAATADLRRHGRLLPIIALTASNTREDRDDLVRVGFDDLWPKPMSLEHIVERCQPYLHTPPAPEDEAGRRNECASHVEQDPRFQEVVTEFVQTLPARVDAIRSALEVGDSAAARESLHQLVGVGGTLGFMPISDVAAHLLAKVKAGSLGDASAELRPLDTMVRDALDGLTERTS